MSQRSGAVRLSSKADGTDARWPYSVTTRQSTIQPTNADRTGIIDNGVQYEEKIDARSIT